MELTTSISVSITWRVGMYVVCVRVPRMGFMFFVLRLLVSLFFFAPFFFSRLAFVFRTSVGGAILVLAVFCVFSLAFRGFGVMAY